MEFPHIGKNCSYNSCNKLGKLQSVLSIFIYENISSLNSKYHDNYTYKKNGTYTF